MERPIPPLEAIRLLKEAGVSAWRDKDWVVNVVNEDGRVITIQSHSTDISHYIAFRDGVAKRVAELAAKSEKIEEVS